MIKTKVKYIGERRAFQNIKVIKEKIPAMTKNEIRDSSMEMYRILYNNYSGHVKTGKTLKSLTLTRSPDNSHAEISVEHGARLLEFGTNSHPISIVRANWLSDGIFIYGKKVTHPGTTGHKFMMNAIVTLFGIGGSKFKNRLKKLYKRVTRNVRTK